MTTATPTAEPFNLADYFTPEEMTAFEAGDAYTVALAKELERMELERSRQLLGASSTINGRQVTEHDLLQHIMKHPPRIPADVLKILHGQRLREYVITAPHDVTKADNGQLPAERKHRLVTCIVIASSPEDAWGQFNEARGSSMGPRAPGVSIRLSRDPLNEDLGIGPEVEGQFNDQIDELRPPSKHELPTAAEINARASGQPAPSHSPLDGDDPPPYRPKP